MGILVYLHLKNRARKLKKKIPKNYKERLKEIVAEANSPVKICFSWAKDGGSHVLNATACKKMLLFNAEWATRLILFDTTETRNSFRLTVGHELTHLDGDIKIRHCKKNDKKFLAWIHEVHADFGGAQKMCKNKRELAVAGIEYKQKLKKSDKDRYSHPSWEKRLYYIRHYDFSKELLEVLANDTGCNNRELIQKVYDYYGSIMLK